MKKYEWLGVIISLVLLGGLFTVTIMEDRVVVELPSDQCEKGLTLIVHEDYTKIKCGYNIVAEYKDYVDYYRTYGEPDKWVNDYRKKTKIKIWVEDESPSHFLVIKEVPYYKGRTGTDGVLRTEYYFNKDKIKWSYSFNHSNTAKHRIRLKMLRFEEEYGYDFIPDDNLYIGMVSGEHYYGDVKGNLFIDPIIQIATSGQYQQTFFEPFDNETDIDSDRTTAFIGWNATEKDTNPHPEVDSLAHLKWWVMEDTWNTARVSSWETAAAGGNIHGSSSAGWSGDSMRAYCTMAFYDYSGSPIPGASASIKSGNVSLLDIEENRNITFHYSAYSTTNYQGGYSPGSEFYAKAEIKLVGNSSTQTIVTKNGRDATLSSSGNFTIYLNSSDEKTYLWTGDTYTGGYDLGTNVSMYGYVRCQAGTFGNDYGTGTAYAQINNILTYYEIEHDNETGIVYSNNLSVDTNYTRVNLTTKTWDDGVGNNGSITCNVSQDNSTWYAINDVDDSVTFGDVSEYFFYRCLLDNNGTTNTSMDLINFTFGEAVSVGNVTLQPTTSWYSNNFTCNYSFYNNTGGSDGDQSTYAWYINDTLEAGYTNAYIDRNTFGPDDNITCEVRPYDGTTYGNKVSSPTIDIHKPEVLSVNVTPIDPYINDTLSCPYTFYNSSNGTGNDYSNISWYVNDSFAVSYLANETATLDNTYFNQNNNVTCTVEPCDSLVCGNSLDATNNVTINYTIAVRLTIEGFSTTKKWESGTTPLIIGTAYDSTNNSTLSWEEVCISIDMKELGTNVSCGNGTTSYNFTIPYVEERSFNNSLDSINILNNDTFFFALYNFSELINATLDINSSQGVQDVRIDIGNDSVDDLILRGNIDDNYLIESRYEDDNTTKTWEFFTNRFDTEYFNLSTSVNVIENVTLTLNASASNIEGTDFTEYWTNDGNWNDSGSTNGDQPTWMLDDITTDVSGRWNFDTSGGAASSFDASNERVKTVSAAAVGCGDFDDESASESAFFNTADLNMQDNNKRWDYSYSCSASGAGASSGYGGGNGVGTCTVTLNSKTDGYGDSVELLSCWCASNYCYDDCTRDCGGSSACSSSVSGTLSLRQKTNGDFEVYEDGSLLKTVTPPSGDTLELKVASNAGASCTGGGGGSGSGSASATGLVNYIKPGGFSNNYSDVGNNFSIGNFELISDTIFNVSNTTDSSLFFQNAIVTFTEQQPSGCDIRVYLGTNGSSDSIWQEFTSGLFTDFTNPGGNLSFKINSTVTSTDDLLACSVSDLNILISSDFVSNISIFWGDSDVSSYSYTAGDLNTTNTPLSISVDYDDLNTYLDGSTCEGVTCRVPLKISTAQGTTGRLEVYNITINQSLDDISFNVSALNNSFGSCTTESLTKCNLTNQVNHSNGTITFSDLAIRYLGDGNITVNATTWNTSGAVSTSLDMIIKYSPFNLLFTNPLVIDYYFNPWSNDLKNITPEGEFIGQFYNRSIQNITSTTFTHSIDIYASHNSTDVYWNKSLGTNYTELYIMNQTDKNTATNISLNTTRQAFAQNLSNSTTTDVYVLLDLYNVTGLPYFNWWNWFESFCSDSGDGYGACVVIS